LVKFERCRISEYAKKEEHTFSKSKAMESFTSEIKDAFIIFEDTLKSIDCATPSSLRIFETIFKEVTSLGFELLSYNFCKKV
jgi:hypothetical protein